MDTQSASNRSNQNYGFGKLVEIRPGKFSEVCARRPVRPRLSAVAERRVNGFSSDPKRGFDPWRRPMNWFWMASCARKQALGAAFTIWRHHGREKSVSLTMADFAPWMPIAQVVPALKRLRAANLIAYTASKDGQTFTITPHYSIAT